MYASLLVYLTDSPLEIREDPVELRVGDDLARPLFRPWLVPVVIGVVVVNLLPLVLANHTVELDRFRAPLRYERVVCDLLPPARFRDDHTAERMHSEFHECDRLTLCPVEGRGKGVLGRRILLAGTIVGFVGRLVNRRELLGC